MGLLLQSAFVLCLTSMAVVNADYIVQVGVHGYLNFRNTGDFRGRENCCDGDRLNDDTCPMEGRCDSQFSFCLKNANDANDGVETCLSNVETTPEINTDDMPINFDAPTWLGLDNPVLLRGIATAWQPGGVQVYSEVRDYDDATNSTELVEIWRLVGSQGVGVFLPPIRYFRRYARLTMSFLVVCAEFYTGSFCENLNECLSDNITCNMRGTCNDLVNGYECSCDPGFTGPECETNIDDCPPLSCSGRGNCTDLINDYECSCDLGFTGPECDMVDHCVNVNCSGNGVCSNNISGYECICDPGFTGNNCQTDINECELTTCSGNGLCTDMVDGFFCNCSNGFNGTECEVNIDDCLGVNCGNGSCVDMVSGFACNCDPGFSGDLCATETGPGAYSGVAAIAGGIVGGLVGVVLIVIGVIVLVFVISRKQASYTISAEKVGPGDNPVYGMGEPAREQNQFTESNYEVDFDNPLYDCSSSDRLDPTYYSTLEQNGSNSKPATVQNQFTESNYEVDFDNPIYESRSTDPLDPTYYSTLEQNGSNTEYATIPENSSKVQSAYDLAD